MYLKNRELGIFASGIKRYKHFEIAKSNQMEHFEDFSRLSNAYEPHMYGHTSRQRLPFERLEFNYEIHVDLIYEALYIHCPAKT